MLLTLFGLVGFLFARCSEQFLLLFRYCRWPLYRFVSDDDSPRMFVPVAVFVEAAIGADGANHAVRGRCVDCRFLHYFFQDEAKGFGALFEQAEGSRVPIDRCAMAEFEFPG